MRIKKKHTIIALICILVLTYTYMFVEPYLVKETVYYEANPDIPASFENTKIVFVTDIHHSKDLSLKRVNKLVDRINAQNPDIILLGGDYANRINYSKDCIKALDRLKAKMGVYGVLGNHDNWAGGKKVREYFDNTHIKILDNKSLWLQKGSERIKLGGVGDLWTDKQYVENTVGDTKESDYVILLSHNPDYAEQLNTKKVDLVLSGHNHGGQVTFFGTWAKLSSRYGLKYRTGVIMTENTKVLVSNGIGTVFQPMRFFARPEINIIYLSSREIE